MTKELLWRGMLASIPAALLAIPFARVYAEPLVDHAIAFEAAREAHAMGHADDETQAPVSRATRVRAMTVQAVGALHALTAGAVALLSSQSRRLSCRRSTNCRQKASNRH